MKTPGNLGNEDGAVFVLVGLAMFLLAAFVGLATDFGVMAYVKNQGQSAVDTAALAAASAIPEYREAGDASLATSRVTMLDAANDVRGASADVAGASLEFLTYDLETNAFTCESGCEPEDVNAVRVTKTDYQAPFFFSWARNAFGGSAPGSIDVAVSASAYLGCPSGLDTDGGIGPIALRECEINYPEDCNVPGQSIYQSGGDNSAFATFNLTGASVCGQIASGNPPNNLQDRVNVGDLINLVGTGQVTSCLKEVEDRFEHCDEASCASDPPDPSCVLPLPVIDCAGPESNGIVVGFASVCITDVNSTGNPKYVHGEIECGPTEPGGPGGACFGTFATRPVLVR
jgi:hypothetical protein